MAFGPLALTPDEFWKLTLAELGWLVDGRKQRREQEREDRAWVVAHLLSPYMEKGTTIATAIDNLLGRNQRPEGQGAEETDSRPSLLATVLGADDRPLKEQKFKAMWEQLQQQKETPSD